MLDSLGLAVKDVAAAIVLLLPGFIAVSIFEAVNPYIARDRQPVQWTMSSLVVSLLLFGAVNGVYRALDWPRDAVDPEFYTGLIGIALVGGYAAGRAASSDVGARARRSLRVLLPPWVWVQTLSAARHVVVHLTDGTVVYGFPRRYTDDPREEKREVYLETPWVLVEDQPGAERRFERLPETEGLLIESIRIQYIQVVAPEASEPALRGEPAARQ